MIRKRALKVPRGGNRSKRTYDDVIIMWKAAKTEGPPGFCLSG